MLDKELVGLVSLVLAVIGYSSYLWSVCRKRTKPHAFSWIVWALILGIVFAAQTEKGAGPGAWAAGFSTLGCLTVAILSLFCGEKDVTRSDWATFGAALMIIPIWYLTADPLWAVILASTIDVLASYPTFRKSRLRPFEESWFIYGTDALKWVPAFLAMEHYSLTTLIYPVVASLINLVIGVTIVLNRQRVIKASIPNG